MSETREQMIARWEREGWLDRDCPGCAVFYAFTSRPPSEVAEPRHMPSVNCESGKRRHCCCDRCW